MRTLRFPDGTTPVVVSADTSALLHAEAAALHDYVESHPGVGPDELSDMLFRVRPVRRHRAVVMAADRADLVAGLGAVATGTDHRSVVVGACAATPRTVAMVFPGQGTQRRGMGALYYRTVDAYAAEIDRVHEAFLEVFGESPRAYLLGEDTDADENATLVQPALFMQMAGLAAMWRSFGVIPAGVVGHSQGEIAACYVSGVMDLTAAITVVGKRARAVDTVPAGEYAMAVLEADRDECEALLARRTSWAEVSVVNSPRMTGISGDAAAVTEVVEHLADKGRFSRIIAVRYPAHTAVMHELDEVMAGAVSAASVAGAFTSSATYCVGSTLGEEITPDLPIADYWFWNLRNVVRFDKAVIRAAALGADTFIELAEHPTLQFPITETLSELTDRDRTVLGTSHRSATDLSVLTRNLAGLAAIDNEFDWDALSSGAADIAAPPLPDFPHTATADSFLWMATPRTTTVAPAPIAAPVVPVVAGRSVTPVTTPASGITSRVVEQWIRLPRRSMAAPATIGIVDLDGASGTPDALADAIIEHADAYGATARLVDAGSADEVDTVVVIAPVGGEGATASVEAAAEFFGERRWWAAQSRARDWWLITRGGESVLDGEVPSVAHAGIAAGFRCLGAEYPDVGFRHLDVADEEVDAAGARKIVAALHTAREPELALRGKDLYVKRLTNAVAAQPITVIPQHVLIVGGTGKVGMEFAAHFGSVGAKRITLVSRSGESVDVRRRLENVCAGGTLVDVVACDVTDAAAVQRLGEAIRSWPVDLIIHAAADLPQHDGIGLEAIRRDHVAGLCDAKVLGVQRILSAVTTTTDVRVLLCSSLAATLGGRGTIVYSVANRMLDALAGGLRADGVDCSSVEWGQWAVHDGSGAAGAAALAAVGYLPMPSSEAVAAGLSVRGNEIVAAFDWGRGRDVLGAFGYGPLLSELSTAASVSAAQVQAVAVPPAVAAPASTAVPVSSPPQSISTVARVVELVAGVIGVADSEAIDTTRPLVALGLDSLQALELRRKVTEEFGFELPVTELVGGASLDDVVRLLEENAPQGAPAVLAPPVAATTSAVAPVAVPAQSIPVAQRVVELVAGVIGVADSEAIDTSRPLVALGLDSLQALELRRKVTEEFGFELPVTELVGGASLDDVVRLLEENAGPASARRLSRDGALAESSPDRWLSRDGALAESSSDRWLSRDGALAESRVETPQDNGVNASTFVGAVGTSGRGGFDSGASLAALASGPAQPAEGGILAERAQFAADRVMPPLDFDRVSAARIDIDRIGLQAMMTALGPAFDADPAGSTAYEIADRLGFVERHRWLLRRWLDALTDSGALRVDDAGRYRRHAPVPAPAQPDLRKVCAELGFRPVLAEFLEACNDKLLPLGRDAMRVQELLFVGGGTDTAEAAYRENLVAKYLNTAASAAVADLAATIGRRRTPVRILELGAGVGGTTNDVVAGLAQHVGELDYHFTDVSDFFLSAAREHFAAYPWMRFGLLDMNAALDAVDERYDMVIASNVLHNAHHIGRLLKRLRDMLNPGGAVVIIESTHAYAQLLTSVQFLMSPADGQPHAGTGDVRAGERIFLSEDEWVDELQRAGLTSAVVLPRPEHPVALLDQRVFVAIRES